MDPNDIVPLAQALADEAHALSQVLSKAESAGQPAEASRVTLWRHPQPGSEVEQSQSKMLGLLQSLNRTLRGPQDYLHELVACNWEKGALYCLLEHSILEDIPLDGEAAVALLAEKSGIPERKLLSLLRLAACEQIVQESSEKTFRHGPISRELVTDSGLKAFIGFQLYETRIASTNLADSLKHPNPFWTGESAFRYALGQPMYDWHRRHPERGARFREAMKSVAASLDPGNQLLDDWFSSTISGQEPCLVVDYLRQPGPTSQFLGAKHPHLQFVDEAVPQDVREVSPPRSQGLKVHVLKSLLWNLADEDCVSLLGVLATALECSPKDQVILVNDLLSPPPGKFAPHVDKAYRRRDVTVMSMHNAKLRTEDEWLALFKEANPNFQICGAKGYSSHSCRGQWELRLT